MAKTKRKAHCDVCSAACAQEWQREAGHWCYPHGHPDVDKNVEHQHSGDANGHQLAKPVSAVGGGNQEPPCNHRKQADDHRRPHKTQLLANGSENEVG